MPNHHLRLKRSLLEKKEKKRKLSKDNQYILKYDRNVSRMAKLYQIVCEIDQNRSKKDNSELEL